MAGRRVRVMTGSELTRTTAARAAAIAEQLHRECSLLLELFRQRESFSPDLAVTEGGRLVSVPPPSSQLEARDRVWRVHSALVQCRGLLDAAVAREDEELGGGAQDEYEAQRKTVKDRLALLVASTGDLLKGAAGQPGLLTLNVEVEGTGSLFEVKLWLYRVYKELDYWIKMTITTLQALTAKDHGTADSGRRKRNARR